MATLAGVYAAIAAAHDASRKDIEAMDDKAQADYDKAPDGKEKDSALAALKQVQASQAMMLYQTDQQMEKQLTEVTSNKLKSDHDIAMTLVRNTTV